MFGEYRSSPFFKTLIELLVPESKDCLFLNVFVPKSSLSEEKAVMISVHGGALSVGSAAQSEYNYMALAAPGNVIVVTINYRLGPLGLLDSVESERDIRGNLGLWDQNCIALKWTKENIAHFEGHL